MKSEVISTIYAETIARRKLPVNFQPKDLVLFEGELTRTIPSTQIVKFEDVLASPEGLLFKGTRIVPESFAFPYHLYEWRLSSVLKFLAKNYGLRRRRKIDRDALWITDYWSTGYFHWLTDVLTRLFVMRDRLRDLLLVLPGTYEQRDVVQSCLKAFGVSDVDFIAANEVVEFRSLLMPSHTAPSGHFKDEAIRGVRDVLLSAYGNADEEKRLYISRQRAGRRRIVNEDEVTSVLRKFDFEMICAEDLSFEQQVAICSRARYVVSNHGAGLTNVLFINSGGSVLELRHEADCVNNCYFTMSSALDLNYFYQTCAPQDPSADPHDAHLLVDPHRLEENVARLFG